MAVGLGALRAKQHSARISTLVQASYEHKTPPVRVKASFGMAEWKSNGAGDDRYRLLENNLYFYSILDAERSVGRCRESDQHVGKSGGTKAK